MPDTNSRRRAGPRWPQIFTRLLASSAMLWPAQVLAQDAARSVASSDGFDEIIVTANKRQQASDTVGMSINAVSGVELKSLNVADVGDLTKIDPSFAATESPKGNPVFAIRGVSFNSDTTGAPPAVSVYIDEAPLTFSAMTKGAALDLERVEILRGPQGTLFGENATGGAINYIAAKPTDHESFGFEATYARFNRLNVNGFMSGPITDTLRARFAFSTDQGGAWQQSTTRNEDLGDRNVKIGRLLLDWTPSDRLKIAINLNHWTDKSEAQAPQLFALAPQVPAFLSQVPAVANEPLVLNGDIRAANWLRGTKPANDQIFYQASGRVDFEITNDINLTYLINYLDFTQNDGIPEGGGDYALASTNTGDIKTFYNELRFSGQLLNDKLKWVIGGTYSDTSDYEEQFVDVSGITGAYALIGLPGVTQPLQFQSNDLSQNITTKAVFGNLDYQLSDSVNIHGGLRYTDTKNAHTGCSRDRDGIYNTSFTAFQSLLKGGVGVVPIPPGGCFTFDETLTPALANDALNEDNVSWRVGIDVIPADGTLLYATVSKGYKAGSFPNIGAASTKSLAPARQESVLAYEVGFKSRFFSNKLDIEGALFRSDYRDKQQQLRVPDPLGVFGFLVALQNVPESRINGAELSVRAKPFGGLTLNGSMLYADSKVTKDFISVNQFVNDPLNFKGEPLPLVSKWTVNLGARYDLRLGNGLNAFAGADGRYQSRNQSYFGVQNAIDLGFPSQFNEGYTILNLRAGIEAEDGSWRVQAFGNNVTNTYYSTSVIRTEHVGRYVGMPATYGLTVGFRY
ncbi:TonB-dependent receptor domain-containing protein [Sphingobium sp. WCS2017Hpa-17]|uniref:TonB-dependent receptor n=1 Tax=Sphingobium sp. WCS2017Hpa-17 TaxID=3073638 RepID=UPI00288AEDBF|nr:TonB-dependent receptor [Sphingobium sp. WCS2017Hpa-17]